MFKHTRINITYILAAVVAFLLWRAAEGTRQESLVFYGFAENKDLAHAVKEYFPRLFRESKFFRVMYAGYEILSDHHEEGFVSPKELLQKAIETYSHVEAYAQKKKMIIDDVEVRDALEVDAHNILNMTKPKQTDIAVATKTAAAKMNRYDFRDWFAEVKRKHRVDPFIQKWADGLIKNSGEV